MTIPAWAIDHWTRPEQSKLVGPAAPHTYGMPSLLSAAARNPAVSAALRPGPWPPAAPSPAAAVIAAVPPATTWVTSAATDTLAGALFLIVAISVASGVFGALTTI